VLALAKVSESDRKKIIWNFMEELWENYLNALENNLPTKFNLLDFFNFGTLKDGFTENDKLYIIKRYAKESGYIKIISTEVSITKEGLKEFQKDIHDWDMNT
jgi:predicted AlkP superfamily phosphohydrolase/phosphomutase